MHYLLSCQGTTCGHGLPPSEQSYTSYSSPGHTVWPASSGRHHHHQLKSLYDKLSGLAPTPAQQPLLCNPSHQVDGCHAKHNPSAAWTHSSSWSHPTAPRHATMKWAGRTQAAQQHNAPTLKLTPPTLSCKGMSLSPASCQPSQPCIGRCRRTTQTHARWAGAARQQVRLGKGVPAFWLQATQAVAAIHPGLMDAWL